MSADETTLLLSPTISDTDRRIANRPLLLKITFMIAVFVVGGIG